jgi:hypothetical protein
MNDILPLLDWQQLLNQVIITTIIIVVVALLLQYWNGWCWGNSQRLCWSLVHQV